MRREFLLNLILLVSINLLIKPFFIFGIDLNVQNRTGSDYGLYFALLNVTFLFQIIGDFGLQNFNNRHVSRYPFLLAKYFPKLLTIKLALTLLYLALSLIVGLLIGYKNEALLVLAILLLNQSMVQFILFLRSNISGLGFYRTDSLLSSLDKLLMLITGILLLWLGPVNIRTFALSQTLALGLTAVIAWMILSSLTKFPLRLEAGFFHKKRRPMLVYLFQQSFPYALVILLMSAYTRMDAVLLERLLPDGKVHADVYAGGYRLLDAANMLGYLFASLLLPMFARLLRQEEDVRPLVSLSFKLIWAGSLTLATTVFFARADLIELMMPGRASAYRWDTLGILIWTFVPVSTTYIFSTLLTADQRLREMNRFFVWGIALDVVLNLVLIPQWKALGSAVAALCTQTFIALVMIYLCRKIFKFRAGWMSVFRVILFPICLAGINWILFIKTDMPLLYKLAAGFAAGGLLLPILGFAGIRKLREI